MISRRLQQQITERALNTEFASTHRDTDVVVTIRINQIAWHRQKPIVIGRVVASDDPLLVGQRYLGTLAKPIERNEDILVGLNYSQEDLDYLSQELDLEAGMTSHEISYRVQQETDARIA